MRPPHLAEAPRHAFIRRPLGRDDVAHSVDECEVGERLGEVAEVGAAVRLKLLGLEAQWPGACEEALAQRSRPSVLADLGKC